jgi:hypothetical protein
MLKVANKLPLMGLTSADPVHGTGLSPFPWRTWRMRQPPRMLTEADCKYVSCA